MDLDWGELLFTLFVSVQALLAMFKLTGIFTVSWKIIFIPTFIYLGIVILCVLVLLFAKKE